MRGLVGGEGVGWAERKEGVEESCGKEGREGGWEAWVWRFIMLSIMVVAEGRFRR